MLYHYLIPVQETEEQYPGTRGFFLVGGEAAKMSREAALTNVSRRWRARRPLASRVEEQDISLEIDFYTNKTLHRH